MPRDLNIAGAERDFRRPYVRSEARIGVPGGYTSQAEPPTVWELFFVWLQARIGVPGG